MQAAVSTSYLRNRNAACHALGTSDIPPLTDATDPLRWWVLVERCRVGTRESRRTTTSPCYGFAAKHRVVPWNAGNEGGGSEQNGFELEYRYGLEITGMWERMAPKKGNEKARRKTGALITFRIYGTT